MLLGATTLVPTVSMAVGLGSIRTNSNLNEKLNAVIPVLSLRDNSRLSVALAPNAVFAKRGIRRGEELGALSFSTYQKGGRTYVKVSSKRPINSPYLNFIVQLNSAEGTVSREYAIFLDPPSVGSKAKQSITKPRLATGKRSQVASIKKATQHKTKRVAHKKTASKPSISGKSGRYGPVRSGETLWSIASHTRPSANVSVHDMLAALKSANPSLSKGLQSGTYLVVPTLSGYKPYAGGYAPMPGTKTATASKKQSTKKQPKRSEKTKPRKNSLENQLRESVAKKAATKKKTAKPVAKVKKPKAQPPQKQPKKAQAEKVAEVIEKPALQTTEPVISDKIVKTISRRSDLAESAGQSVTGDLKEQATTGIDSVADTAKTAVDSATDKSAKSLETVGDSAKNVSDVAENVAKVASENVADTASTVAASVGDATSAVATEAEGLGTKAKEAVADGLNSADSAVTEATNELQSEVAELTDKVAGESATEQVLPADETSEENSTVESAAEEQSIDDAPVIKSIPRKDTTATDEVLPQDEQEVTVSEDAAAETSEPEVSVTATEAVDTPVTDDTMITNTEESLSDKASALLHKATDAISNNLPVAGGGAVALLGLGGLLLLRKRRKVAGSEDTSGVVLLDEEDIDAETVVVDEKNVETDTAIDEKATINLEKENSESDEFDEALSDLSLDDAEATIEDEVSTQTFSSNDSELAPDNHEDSDFITDEAETEEIAEKEDADKNKTASWSYSFGGLANKKQTVMPESEPDKVTEEVEAVEEDTSQVDLNDELDSIDFDSALLGLDDTISENKGEKPTTTYMSDLASSVASEEPESSKKDDIDFNLDEVEKVSESLVEKAEQAEIKAKKALETVKEHSSAVVEPTFSLLDDDDDMDTADDALNIEDSVATTSFSSDNGHADIDSTKVDMKLDLAKSFLSIGDTNRAVDLLEEVVQKGNEEQIQEAKKLLLKKDDLS